MPRVSASALWQRLAQGQVASCYLLYGPETYLRQEYTQTLVERILGSASQTFNYEKFQADAETLDEVLSVAQTLPLLSAHRLVVVDDVQQFRKAEWQRLERYLEQPVPTTVLVCRSPESDLKKFPPTLAAQALVLECPRLEGPQLQEWAARVFAQAGYRIAPEALHAFLQAQEADLQTLANEIAKLCLYAGEPREITVRDVHEVTQASHTYSVFALSDALGTRQTGQALRMLEHLLSQGEPPLVILSMMVRHIRLLWSAQQLIHARQTPAQMAKTLGLPLTVCRQLATQSQRVSGDHLRRLYTHALEADLALKTSRKPPQAILEEWIFALCLQD